MGRRTPVKRPTDVNRLAHFLGEQSTKDTTAPSSSEISRVMSALGKRGGKVGGKARAEQLTPERRSEIARDAAKKRWTRPKR